MRPHLIAGFLLLVVSAVLTLQLVPANTTQPAQVVTTQIVVRIEYVTVTMTVSNTVLQTVTQQATFTQALTRTTLSTITETSTSTVGLSFPQANWQWITLFAAFVAFVIGYVLRPFLRSTSQCH